MTWLEWLALFALVALIVKLSVTVSILSNRVRKIEGEMGIREWWK